MIIAGACVSSGNDSDEPYCFNQNTIAGLALALGDLLFGEACLTGIVSGKGLVRFDCNVGRQTRWMYKNPDVWKIGGDDTKCTDELLSMVAAAMAWRTMLLFRWGKIKESNIADFRPKCANAVN